MKGLGGPSESDELVDTEGTGSGKRLDGFREVAGGAACCYQLEEKRVGNLVRAQHRDTHKKYWILTSARKPGKRDQERRQRLELIRSLDHPNVLKMVDVFQDNSHVYVVYEDTEGGNAAALSAQTGAVSEHLAAAIMQQVFAALSHCHSKGLVLQSFSLQHIFVSGLLGRDCPSVKVLVPFETKLQKDLMGIAPELKNKTHISPLNDMWNCGVILSTLIAGQSVFKNMQASFTSQEFRSAYNKWHEVSKPAKSLTLALIARDYNKRPSPEKCLQHAWILDS